MEENKNTELDVYYYKDKSGFDSNRILIFSLKVLFLWIPLFIISIIIIASMEVNLASSQRKSVPSILAEFQILWSFHGLQCSCWVVGHVHVINNC